MRSNPRVFPGRGTVTDMIRYPDGYIPAAFAASALRGARRVLVVGDVNGRDSGYLATMGMAVEQVDLVDRPGVVCQSIEDRTPFPDDHFDGIVMAEVLEHLYRDRDALEEVRRILKPTGTLVVTVPCSRRQDRPDYHFRIHTARTITRLLNHSGFAVVHGFERGIVTRLPQCPGIRPLILATQMVISSVVGARAVEIVNRPLARLERVVGSTRGLRLVQRLFISHGILLACRPAMPMDADAVQRQAFQGDAGQGRASSP